MKKYKRILPFIFLIAGGLVFFRVLQNVGPGHLKIIVPALSGLGPLVFLIYPFMCAWDALAWRELFPKASQSSIPFFKLYTIRLAGEAVNNITPFLDIGGEFLKVSLVRRFLGIDAKSAAASVVMGRIVIFLAEILFWVFAVFVIERASAAIAAIFACALLTFFAAKYFFKRYKIETGFPFRAFCLNFLGWASGGVEMYFMFRLVGAEISFFQALMFESLLQLVRTVSFFIPGNLGAQEAGVAFLAQTMGYPPFFGVAVSLLKRMRQILWTVLGFVIWGIFERT